MFNLSLTACSFSLKRYHSRYDYYYLNDKIEIDSAKGIKEYKVEDLFISFFQEYLMSIHDDDKQKTFHCVFNNSYQGETKDYYYLYTIIKSGSYGSSSDILDNETNKVIFNVKPNQTPVKPFYLYIIIPKDSKRVKVQKGMLFFQNVGPYGVKTITTDYIKEFFSKNYKISLNCKTVASNLFIERMLTKDKVLKLIMTKNHISGDTCDNIYKGYGTETREIGNLHFSDNVWTRIKRKIEYFSKGRSNLFEFDDIDYDGLKLNVDIGGRQRTINMNNLENLSLIEAIPDEVRTFDGHANEKLLLSHFEKVAEEYLKEMVLQIN